MSKDKKKSSGAKGKLTGGRLNYMIRDLRKIKQEFAPNDAEEIANLDISNLDDFQKQKQLLNKHLSNITQNVAEMNDLKKKRGGVRDPQIIAMQNDNYKALKQAEEMWLKLKDAFEKGVKKGKLDPKTLEDRRKFVELFGKEMMKLQEANSGIRRNAAQEVTNTVIAKNRERAKQRADRRAQRKAGRDATRKAARGGSGNDEDIEMEDLDSKAPVSAAEQQFMMEVQENDKRMDQLLDVISAGLKDLKEIATDIGTNLDVQNEMLKQVDDKMDNVLENYETANDRLRKLLDENTGGVETWCPILILIIILLGIVGYIFSIAK